MHPLFLVSDGLDRPCELDISSPERPVIRIRRGQVFSAEFAQVLTDLFQRVDSVPRDSVPVDSTREAGTTIGPRRRRAVAGSSRTVDALTSVLAAHGRSVIPEQSTAH